ncbi:mitogen-activated protein kinase-binding protein 1-like [Gadus chalcogrammus]|uniref:mitogen-activated protein kinase-binding protein 1-like n=1 Tax=Gadus chalcogrammus TaxID=1042646 RepID=UPI0024C47D3E|nr:mitogen-activated protein kinase-binding protein 1-like [Gadus chalcogrammus]
MPGDGSTIKKRIRKLLRSPSVRLNNPGKKCLTAKVTLEKVLGITAAGHSGLACDPHSGLVAYPAGCVVVLLNPKKNRQQHLINTSRKSITALAFSPDGKHLVTGESGHLPAVRLWDVSERRQVAELQKHNYGVSCVAFSPNSKYIVSVGTQHDMTISVWAWKKDVVVAVNKVSSKVTAVSFSEDSSYFVTAGVRHIKFWYLDPCKPTKALSAVPLLGRSGLLGELRNTSFCDVACGRGSSAGSTFCVSSSGLLCEFNGRRTLDKWVDLRTGAAQSLSLSDGIVFCGGADGTVRCFSPADLSFLGTLPRPHPLGSHVGASSPLPNAPAAAAAAPARYPDTVAVTYDPASRWLSCVYADHSVYVWDVRDVRRAATVHRALYHAAGVWDLQDLMSVIYTDESAAPTTTPTTASPTTASPSPLLEADGTAGDGATGENRAGIRSICVSPDGNHLASGDRNGRLRVHDLGSMKEILKVDAHDGEILCLEYSQQDTGLELLASAGRDRLIHVFDAGNAYRRLQTLDEHSSSITAVRFAAKENSVRLISCGADKSIYFRTAHTTHSGTEFRRSHHVSGKTTLYDMGVDPTCKYAAVGCQDRAIRIFNISTGKQKKLYKGSVSEDGSLLKVQMDPSGLYLATSCSDKNISIFDFHTGECVANMFGHSEVVTGMKFTNDCTHLISVSGDSCIFVWRLAAELTMNMRERLCQLRTSPGGSPSSAGGGYGAPAQVGLSSDSDHEHEEEEPEAEPDRPDDGDSLSSTSTTTDNASSNGGEEAGAAVVRVAPCSPVSPDAAHRPRRRWSYRYRMGSLQPMVRSLLDLRQLDSFSSIGSPEPAPRTPASTLDLRVAPSEGSVTKQRPWPHQDWLFFGSPKGSKGTDGGSPRSTENHSSPQGSAPPLNGRPVWMQDSRTGQDVRSADSPVSLGYGSRVSSPDPLSPHDSASVTSIGADSSDEERSDRGEEEGERQRGFLKQNFESLGDTSNIADLGGTHGPSISSCFRGNRNRSAPLFAKSRDGSVAGMGGPTSQPPVSKVRPMLEGVADNQKTPRMEGTSGPDVGPSERAPQQDSGAQRKSGPWRLQQWRPSGPPPKAAPLAEVHAASQNPSPVQNPASHRPLSPAHSSGAVAQLQPRPQHLSVDPGSHGSPSPLPSPSRGSAPPSPLPWASPRTKARRSYMSPTTSSSSKRSHASSSARSAERRGSLDAEPRPSKIPLPRRTQSLLLTLGLRPEPKTPALPRPRASTPVPLGADLPASRPEHSVTLETCIQAVGELHNSLKRTVTLYSLTLSGGCDAADDQEEMRKVLSEALGAVRAQLDPLPCGGGAPDGPLGPRGGGDRAALALLEQYSELLLRSVEKRLDGKT